jgi:hypothetical protein
MSRVPNTSKAQPFEVHAEGGPFAFKIVRVDDYVSKNNTSGYPDKYKISLDAVGDQAEGHVNMVIFPVRSEKGYLLKMICEAIGMGSEGGYDSEQLVGKCFQAEVAHNEWNNQTYANLIADSVAPYESAKDDDNLPF